MRIAVGQELAASRGLGFKGLGVARSAESCLNLFGDFANRFDYKPTSREACCSQAVDRQKTTLHISGSCHNVPHT